MPKKQAKNSFFFFMLDFKEESRKKGVILNNMREVQEAASPVWVKMLPAEKAKYEAMARKEKERTNTPFMKFTSTGIPLAELERREKEEREAEEMEKKDITNIVKLKAFNGQLQYEEFYLMDVNYYCQYASSEYLVSEMTILKFNLLDGIKVDYHVMINPGKIPIGYASDVKYACEELGLDMPDETGQTDYFQVLATIIDYLSDENGPATKKSLLPPIFTMPNKVAPVQNFIRRLCMKAAQDETMFRIYKLDTLFFMMANAVKQREDEGFPKESLALMQLTKDSFQYSPDLECEHHHGSDKAVKCTRSRVKRWALTVLDHVCPIMGITMRPGYHLPEDFDLDAVLEFKEQHRPRAAPTVAVSDTASNAGSYAASCSTAKRSHKPVRLPTNFSMITNANPNPAPELNEDNFPKFSMGIGRGRGRNP